MNVCVLCEQGRAVGSWWPENGDILPVCVDCIAELPEFQVTRGVVHV